MDYWLIALGVAFALFLAAFFWPYKLTMSLQARGADDGHFAAAGGLALGPLTATLVVARGVPLNVALLLFGRRLTGGSRQPQPEPEPQPEPVPAPEHDHEPSDPRAGSDWIQSFVSKLELSRVLDYLFSRRRWIGLDGLELGFDYSTKDVALTGQILAAMCAASAFLPAKVVLRHNPSWELSNRATLSVDGRFRLRPGLFICDTLWFVLRTLMLHRPRERRWTTRKSPKS